MPGIVRSGLIQARFEGPVDATPPKIRKTMLDKHAALIESAAAQGVQVCCMQELFCGPYFCAEQDPRWFALAERVPGGAVVRVMQDMARRLKIVLIVPVFEEETTGIYFNTTAVIDADGKFLGKYRKCHIPQVSPGFWEKFYFAPGNLGYPVFETKVGRIGVYMAYDRHFPEVARLLGLGGAEVVFNPSTTVSELSEYLWKLEQPSQAVANHYFVGAVNRVGREEPWNIGAFYGQSYFCDPRGQILAVGSRDREEVVVADLNLDMIPEARNTWPFFRDRRPETYGDIVAPVA